MMVLAAAASSLVLGAAYYVPDAGTVARARGGAFCAAADDPLAIRYNPAGLADLRDPQLLVDGTAMWLDMKFARTGVTSDSQATSTTADSNPPIQIVPALLYSHPIGDRFNVTAGLHAPAGPRTKFRKNGVQRFTNDSLYNAELAYGVAGAWRINPYVSAGVSFEGIFTEVIQEFVITGKTTAPPSEDPQHDIPSKLDVSDPFTPSATLGVKVTPAPWLEIGISYRPTVNQDMKGELIDQSGSTPTEKVTFHVELPSILRLGVRYVAAGWDVELDYVMEDWSGHRTEVLTADDGFFFVSNEGVQVREFVPAHSVRLGGSWTVSAPVEIHGGLYYETSAVPADRMDVGTYDADKTGLNVGVSYQVWKRVTVSGNYSRTFVDTVKVTDSKVRQQSPFGAGDDALAVIGNGTYSGHYDFIGLSVLTKF